LKAKKALKRKKPSRRDNVQYWSESQFKQLQGAAPGKLYSKGPIPWRLLAYLLKISPEVARVRTVLRKRLMDESRLKASEKTLDHMLLTLAAGGFVTLEPEPPKPAPEGQAAASDPDGQPYAAIHATPTPELDKLLVFRGVHPLYGAYLINQLGTADRTERLQAMESVLEVPRPVLKYMRVPLDLPPGPLASTRLDAELIRRGLIVAPVPKIADEEEEENDEYEEYPPTFSDKLRLLFDALYPDVVDVHTQSVWCAGELLRFGGNFNQYVQSRDLVKQEGIVFRHLLRMILLCGEFALVTPPDTMTSDWQADLRELSEQLTACCRAVDPTSTDEIIELAHAADVVEGEAEAKSGITSA
jgi:hypothetical protein